MSFLYLGGILAAMIGVGLIDARWKLALFARPKRAALAIFGTVIVLLTIDLLGIYTGNFMLGESRWMTGIEVLPHLPIEELAFIVFLSYVSLVAVTAAVRVLHARGRPSTPAEQPESERS